MQRARTARVRTAALGTTVGLCLIIPLAAASADSAHTKSPSADGKPSPTATATPKGTPSGHDFGNGVAPGGAEGIDSVKQLLAPTSAAATGATPAASASTPPAPAASAPVSNALCGKAVEVPGGVRAQTCVEREGGEIWARVYYRNPTRDPLLLVLSLLRPDAGTVQIRCTIDAAAGDGQCETPRLRSDEPLSAWSAVAEIATADGSRKVLRSGTAAATGMGTG
ncbi:hypothetical protein [Yinghuangia seranimata]|uniref:hypothetical protein n=1 Tax=Yinghuangia seranimata TaxID=408067 RepID=UPI00248B5FAC|nr:hypothetical protein [Yinghuangia seranimata]MDI2131893.1 hypothetical protein [Yinghuangia seranimata]